MIRYALLCEHDHEFEAWFKSIAAFDDQKAAGELVCPVCESHDIRKAIMAPNVATKGAVKTKAGRAQTAEHVRDVRTQFMAAAKRVREHVEQNFDYVGNKFPEEVRRQHYGEAETRDVYGEATPEEARDLIEEGIDVAPLPPDPKKAN